mgnify:CR=1 FL=1
MASDLSELEYLQIERAADFKSEFFGGEMFPMTAQNQTHSLITANLIGELGNALKRGPCLVFDGCEPQRFLDSHSDTLLNPTLLIEVLSDSTEAYDRGIKFEHYRQIPSLREYLLVSHRDPRLEQFIREPRQEWRYCDVLGFNNTPKLESVPAAISLTEIFAGVQFEAARRLRTPPSHDA